ncbi:MAG: hypothetical protein AMJ78_02540 [Omnitrophica WOR_2 bacterium SM23_29]|nr:MAG: hypothetical protein AMJ78_02540 [Omnitrophica WOR_2 bacterium SM23_29]
MSLKKYLICMHLILPFFICLSSLAEEPHVLQPTFKDEPTILELQRAAIRYAEVNPGKITNWRRQAAIKALLPEVSVGYDNNTYRTISSSSSKGEITFAVGPDDLSYGWDFSLSWDLGELIYNHDQTTIDSRSKLMVQLRNDVLEQLNKAYFERKRLQTELTKYPDKTSQAYIERQLKIEELTATIDGLTGGYLSRKIEGKF